MHEIVLDNKGAIKWWLLLLLRILFHYKLDSLAFTILSVCLFYAMI